MWKRFLMIAAPSQTCHQQIRMRAFVLLLPLFVSVFLIVFSISAYAEDNKYKVIKVIDGDTVYVDFNNDGIPQQDEKVRLNGIDTFEVKPSPFLDWQTKHYNLTQDEALGLGYFGKEFAKKHLLNKSITAKYTGETKRCDMGRHLMSIYYDNGKNYEEEVLKAGLAVIYKQSNLAPQLYKYENLPKTKANAQKTHQLELVLLNNKNGKYHKPTCEYGLMASNVELVEKPILNFNLSNCCSKNSTIIIPAKARKINEVDSEAHNKKHKPFDGKFHKLPEKPIPDIKT